MVICPVIVQFVTCILRVDEGSMTFFGLQPKEHKVVQCMHDLLLYHGIIGSSFGVAFQWWTSARGNGFWLLGLNMRRLFI